MIRASEHKRQIVVRLARAKVDTAKGRWAVHSVGDEADPLEIALGDVGAALVLRRPYPGRNVPFNCVHEIWNIKAWENERTLTLLES